MDTWADEGLLGEVSVGQVGKTSTGGRCCRCREPTRAEDLVVRKHYMGAVSQPAFPRVLDPQGDNQ